MKVLTIAWEENLIDGILHQVEKRTDIKFFHYVHRQTYFSLIKHDYCKERLFLIPDQNDVKNVQIDNNYLAEIEKFGDYTINNLILSDRVLHHLDSKEAFIYASVQAETISSVIQELNPDYVIGSWDTILPGLAYLICKKNRIPFYVLKFSVIPSRYLNICEYPTPIKELPWVDISEPDRLKAAEHILDSWLNRDISAPAYVSVRSTLDIFKKAPFHFNELYKRIKKSIGGGHNKFIEYSVWRLLKQYFRKKGNIVFRNKKLFISSKPPVPFFFFGFHMQPESSIDVWAPFYSNQYHVVESIVRSMPAGRLLCLKIHISDADNYTNTELKRYLKLPNVRIVSPLVSSRTFIEDAEMIFAIQGTIGLEGALLGKPTIMFGDSTVKKFSSVSKVQALDSLPQLVKEKLKESAPSRQRIVEDFSDYLRYFQPSSTNDWFNGMLNGLSEDEIENYVKIFNALNQYKHYS